jgi:hypothetical protein
VSASRSAIRLTCCEKCIHDPLPVRIAGRRCRCSTLQQRFDDSYIIEYGIGERVPLTKTAQVRMCVNSVCPQVGEALVRANFSHEQRYEAVA